MRKPFVLIKITIVVLLLTTLAAQGVPFVVGQANSGKTSPTIGGEWSGQDGAIQQALARAVSRRNNIPAFLVYDIGVQSIRYAQAGDQAEVWMVMADKVTGKVLATEPGLALAYRNADGWQISLPGDADFQAQLAALPAELLTPIIHDNFIIPAGGQALQSSAPIGGFYLPWAAGKSKWLTQGANHLSCPRDCRYATDWADDTNFPILAAKGGVVYAFRDSCQNDDHACVNYFIVQDRSTTPYSYHFYFHLAHDSIPAGLKVTNAPVLLGQWIANVDNTGNSTGSHLHFMAVTSPFFCIANWCNGDSYWWGTSVDITFEDVHTNWDTATQGGRPCTRDDVTHGFCTEWQSTYKSGNPGAFPLNGDLMLPVDHSLVSDANLTVSGWATSDLGISRLQVISNYDGNWREIGASQTTTPFTMALDVCAAGIPDGVFDLALRAWDNNGDQSSLPIGLRHLVKDTHCSPPPTISVCVPTTNQIALFAQPDFGGTCVVLEQGNYPNAAALALIWEHGVASLKVGGNVKAILYSGTDFGERQETFTSNDHNLADNRVNSQQISSVKVVPRTTVPAALTVANPIPGPGGKPLTSIDSVVLSWGKADGATLFQARVLPGAEDCTTSTLSPLMVRDYTSNPTWSIGTLPESTTLPGGGYKLCVRMRASGTPDTMWYGRTFVVAAGELLAATPLIPPYSDDMESQDSGWVASGLWHWANDPRDGASNHSWVFNNGNGYSGDPPPMGDLTSPPVSLPSTGNAYLRFDYHYHTEASTPHWDQRWLQISTDGGQFVNLVQLADDSIDTWLHSPSVDLSSYAGSTIRLRFHFDSIDAYYNNGLAGWAIDNVTINSNPPPAGCNEAASNDSMALATPISFDQTTSADICPAGDVDYYKFSASKDDVFVVDVNAQTLNPPSQLDPTMALFMESDPTSVLAENDDELLGMQLDPYLVFSVPETGNYYLRVKAYDHPGMGGPTYNYTLNIHRRGTPGTDNTDPSLSLTNPSPGLAWRQGLQVITAQASDNLGGSGMHSVEFYWHPADWDNTAWQLLNTDWNGANGWNALLDASRIPEGQAIAIAARATDWAGNVAVTANWSVFIDNTPPQVTFNSLPATLADNLIPLQWTASDAASGIDSFDLEVNRDGGGWQPVDTHLPGTTRQVWYLGEFGRHYDFRLQGVDHANNLSLLIQTNVSLVACTPDSLEPDNSLANARTLILQEKQLYNFCGVGDQDWVKFTPQAGQSYLFWAVPGSASGAQPALGLYATDGTRLMEVSSMGNGLPAGLMWIAPDDSTYFLKVNSLNPDVAGDDITYYLMVAPGYYAFLPFISR